MEVLNGPRDLAQVKRDLAAAGYNGEKFVFLVPTDLPAINAMSEVAADVFRKLGMNMDYQALDWATVAQRLNSREPLGQRRLEPERELCAGLRDDEPGGAWLPARTGPAVAVGLADHAEGRGPAQRMDRRDRSARAEAAVPGDSSQAFRDVPYIPLGAFFFASAYRNDLTGILKGSVPLFTNVRRG